MRFSKAQNVEDLRRVARRRLPRFVFDFIDGGVEDEAALARNRAAFKRLQAVPRYLVDTSRRTADTTLFGRRHALPFGIAPTGLAHLGWPGADLVLARAAAAADIPFVLSTSATTTIERVVEAAPDHTWFQLYVPRDREVCGDLLKRAGDAGAIGLMVTVDVPLPAKRERDLRNGFLPATLRSSPALAIDVLTHPSWSIQMLRNGMPRFENFAPYAAPKADAAALAAYLATQITRPLDWDDIAWLRDRWRGRFVIKGILSRVEVECAVTRGVDGLLISNHGGRQLDSAPAPIEIIPAIRAAVGDRLVLALDSGVRRGSDVAKALALGADFVFVGRATLYGAAAGGGAGVTRAIAFLADELDRFQAQTGCPSIAALRELEILADPGVGT
jgi:L-lactate dehydrogenase (cytochrome)/(S)-mandelate dehydrogenase